MNITLLAAEIAQAIPEMSRDSRLNNEDLIARLIAREISRSVIADSNTVEKRINIGGGTSMRCLATENTNGA
jgi:sulfur transfer complex TusBCD TusB component (DsrH family)